MQLPVEEYTHTHTNKKEEKLCRLTREHTPAMPIHKGLNKLKIIDHSIFIIDPYLVFRSKQYMNHLDKLDLAENSMYHPSYSVFHVFPKGKR